MKLPDRWSLRLPDSVLARLLGLVLTSLVVSHLITGVLLFWFVDGRPPEHEFRPPRAVPPPADMAPPFGDGRGAPPKGMPVPMPPRGEPPRHVEPRREHGTPPGVWLALAVQFVLVSAAAAWGARGLARPIRDLAAAAQRLGDNLDSPPIAERGPEEARRAARVFNRMQQRIRAQIDERGRFLAAVSHDLRTPLTRMKLRLASLPEGPATARLREDIADMAAMLDATLNYLRNDAHTETWQWLDVQALVESLADDAGEQGAPVSVAGSARPILAQPLALRRCLSNLVDNALRYGQRADIVLIDDPMQLGIEVRDNGPGIPENRMAAVMEPFVRLEESRHRDTGGVGLGLAIAREGARRNGGELRLANRPEGGLVAVVSLPRRDEAGEPGQCIETDTKGTHPA